MLKYLDALQSCPASDPGNFSTTRVDLPADTQNWLGLSLAGNDTSGSVNKPRSAAAIIDVSGRKVLQLQNYAGYGGVVSVFSYLYCYCPLPVISGAKAVVHFALSVAPSVNTTFTNVFTWGTPSASGEATVAATGLVVRADRTFMIGATASTYQLPAGSTAYLELEFDLVAHTVNLYANDTLIISAVSIASITSPFAGKLINESYEFTGVPGAVVRFSDILLMDDSGTDFNARLGPVRVDRLPLATQTTTNFTVTGAANAIAAIDNQDLSAASYTESPVTNNTPDMFTVDVSSVGAADTVYGLVIKGQSFKSTAAGLRGLNLILDDGGTVSKQSAGILSNVPSSPGVGFVIPKDKAAAAWTDTSLAAIKVGYEATLS